MHGRFLKMVPVVLLGAALSGCQQMGAGLSGSSCPITGRDAYTVIGDAKGTSWAVGLAGLQLWPTSAYNALQKAKKESGGDGLINLQGNNKIYYIVPPFNILSIHQMEISGEAIKFQRLGATN